MAARKQGRPVALAALLLAVCGTAFLSTASSARAATSCPWMNPAIRPAARAAMLLAAMRPGDKLALLSGVDASFEPYEGAGDGYSGFVPANPTLCIPPLTLNDGPAGVAHGLVGTTAFPAPIAQAATWNRALQRGFGAAVGREAWQKGIDVLLAPNVNIARVPENGRNFEAFGEDPFLSAQTAVAEVQGIQRNPVIATVKHFAVNSQETNRYWVTSVVDDRTLHEIYFPPFEAAVRQAHVGAVMCAYGTLNAVFACQDPLLTTVLRQEFDFNGIVMSDWGATHSTVAAADAGLDLEMPTGANFGAPLVDALSAGTVTAATVDGMTRDVLTSTFRLGLFDHPPPPRATAFTADVSTPGHDSVARKLAEESTVLLKNARRTLPLRLARGATIAVIGAPALGDITPFVSGGGSAYVAATNAVTPLAALTARAAKAGDTVVSADGSDQASAAALAGSASVAIVFAYDQEREGQDRPNLDLTAGQDQLIEQVARANPNTIVVLDTGGPVLMPWLKQVPAVLEAWYPGQADGDAIAAILFGDVDPSGRLPQTFPTSDTALPTSTPSQWPGANDAQDAIFSEGLDVGYRWYDVNKVEPLFPFGHGLSYTRFTYRHLRVRRRATSVRVSFTVENTGARAGKEVSQLYVDDPRIDGEPPRQLKGYRKFFLRPRHSARVTLVLPLRAFAHWDSTAHVWAVSPGLYRILVGDSSRDIRLHGFVRQSAHALGG
jgi:beta-glucosidase